MPTTLTIDPVTRIEGHLEIQVTVDTVGGQQQVTEARCAGTMFRGFEIVLAGRDPRDAALYTQRICGVCPVSHALAACLALEDAFGIVAPDNGRILRNLVLGANYIQSHVLHFYHLSLPDFIDTTGLLDASPWTPRYVRPDLIGGAAAATLVQHYVSAFTARRKAHQMGALFAGKLPCVGSFVAGGCTQQVSAENVAAFRTLLNELRAFIQNVYLPDANLLATAFPAYSQLGQGGGNLLTFGAFDLNAGGTNKLFARGRRVNGTPAATDPQQITEQVARSWYTPASGNRHPSVGLTEPDRDRPDGYSWLKAPRYGTTPYELGPLARMTINGEYTRGISAMDRILARAQESLKLANAMAGWLDELVPGAPVVQAGSVPQTAAGVGLTEAPRGGLGHWLSIDNGVINRYQVITPTNWNASPRDDSGVPGPIEAALVGVPVDDLQQPSEVLRVVHSFDPCLACAVHAVRPGRQVNR